jgi:hypothetical protein
MNSIVFRRKFEGAEALGLSKDALLLQKESKLFLLDPKENEILAESDHAPYLKKIVLSPDGREAFLLSGLVKSGASRLELLSLATLEEGIPFLDAYVKDACYSLDSKTLYYLFDRANGKNGRAETLLGEEDLATGEKKTYFEGEGAFFDRIRIPQDARVPVLFDPQGKVVFFGDGKVLKTLEVPSYRRLFFFDNGEFLTDTDLGLRLFSRNGRKIQEFRFLLPSPLSPEEAPKNGEEEAQLLSRLEKRPTRRTDVEETVKDLSFDRPDGLLFLLSQVPSREEYYLYVLKTEDFSLVQKIRGKGVPVALSFSWPYLSLETMKAFLLYEAKERKPLSSVLSPKKE